MKASELDKEFDEGKNISGTWIFQKLKDLRESRKG